MAEQPDLELPELVPEMEAYQEEGMDILPFAFYTLADLTQDKMEAFRELCATDIEDDSVELPPQWNFRGQSLRAIIRSHVKLSKEGHFDPTYFIVAAYAESSTVVLVALDADLDCKPDLAWAFMNEAGLVLVNLQIANTDWFEQKESDRGGPRFSPGPGDLPRPDRDKDDIQSHDSHDWSDDSHDYSSDYELLPPAGFHIELYTADGVDGNDLAYQLQPGQESQQRDRARHACKPHRLPPGANQEPARVAANLHPSRCLLHPTLEKYYFLVGDTPDFVESGVQVVRVDWDGVTDGKSEQELLDVGQSASFQTQRANVAQNADRAAVGLVCVLAQGYQQWNPEHKLFAVYGASSRESDPSISILKAIDSCWGKRGHGENRAVVGGYLKGKERDSEFWRRLCKKHIAFCRNESWEPNFVSQYFLWYDEQQLAKPDSQMSLVKLDWDGDMQSAESVLADITTKVSTCDVLAKEAHSILTDVFEGKKDWGGWVQI